MGNVKLIGHGHDVPDPLWLRIINAALVFEAPRPIWEFDFFADNVLVAAGATVNLIDENFPTESKPLYVTGWGVNSPAMGLTPCRILCSEESIVLSNGPGNRIGFSPGGALGTAVGLQLSEVQYRHAGGPHRLKIETQNNTGGVINVSARIKGFIGPM